MRGKGQDLSAAMGDMEFLPGEPSAAVEAIRPDLFEHAVKRVARFLIYCDTSLWPSCNPGTILDKQTQTHGQSD